MRLIFRISPFAFCSRATLLYCTFDYLESFLYSNKIGHRFFLAILIGKFRLYVMEVIWPLST